MAKLIILEGLDGSGKSTQAGLLELVFAQSGMPYRKIKLPDYDSPSSTLVKMYLDGQFGDAPDAVNAYAAGAFYAVDRYASYKLDWQADYLDGKVILADRYATSNCIYQMEKLDPMDWDAYLEWSSDFEYRKIGIPKPDLVIFLDMPVAVSQQLMSGRYAGDETKKDVHERNVPFLENCRRAALFAAEKQGWHVVPCANAGRPRTIEDIHNSVMQIVKKEVYHAGI